MRIKYLGQTSPLELTNGKVYDVISIERGWYRIIDDEGINPDETVQGYLYPPELFTVVDEDTYDE